MKKNIFFFFFVFSYAFNYAQSTVKTPVTDANLLLKKINPNNGVSWVVVHNEYAHDTEIQSSGKINYMPQFSGFKIDADDEGFYYIAQSAKGNISYITDLAALKSFIGTVDNGEEAVLALLSQGYFPDLGYKDLAANYQDKGKTFVVEMSKITSASCPLAKSYYELTVDKKTGAILQEKDLGRYSEIYNKDCTNNPHYAELEKQIAEAKAKAEEQKRIQKEINLKMKKRLEKQRRKD